MTTCINLEREAYESLFDYSLLFEPAEPSMGAR